MLRTDVVINAVKERSYPIFIGENLSDNIYELMSKYTKANKFLVVTNETVYPLYGEKLKKNNTEFVILPDGEIYKNIDTLNRILDRAFSLKLERKDAIVALGGGVIGDMAGFAASIYQRGIDYIQVPTTLLSQVDSSVGGKVAVNHICGKNMIGAFYQPKAVISDINTLYTLDDRQYKTGLSEVLKYAFIEKSCCADENYNLFEFLECKHNEILRKEKDTVSELIMICCKLKSAVVNQDEKEKGKRAILNFGHTYAHAFEKITDYNTYTHGEAVSIGMKKIFDLAKRLNKIDNAYYERCINLLKTYNLQIETKDKYNPEEVYEIMTSDKKVADKKINFVLPCSEKEVEIRNNIDKKYVTEGI